MLHFHINSFAIAKENVIYVLRLNAFEIFAVHGNILSNESVSLHLVEVGRGAGDAMEKAQHIHWAQRPE